MTIFNIRTDLWPSLGHYNAGMASPLSLVAFQLQIMSQIGNLADGAKGQYFFRDLFIPTPRAATWSAWRSLLGIGNSESPFFYCPFLPANRADDEGGVAGSLRGVGAGAGHINTLSRRSSLHIRDASGRISWGAVYIGRWDSPSSQLLYEISRSDIPESIVTPRKYQSSDPTARVQGGLRSRMEFLAQFGVPATSASNLPLKAIRRILFQILNQESARDFAEALFSARVAYESDVRAEQEDYSALLGELAERYESRGKATPERVVKKTRGGRVQFSLDDIDLTL